MGNKSDEYYMEKALIEIKAIIAYTENLSFEEFMNDIKTIDAAMFRFQQMIEHIKEISSNIRINILKFLG